MAMTASPSNTLTSCPSLDYYIVSVAGAYLTGTTSAPVKLNIPTTTNCFISYKIADYTSRTDTTINPVPLLAATATALYTDAAGVINASIYLAWYPTGVTPLSAAA